MAAGEAPPTETSVGGGGVASEHPAGGGFGPPDPTFSERGLSGHLGEAVAGSLAVMNRGEAGVVSLALHLPLPNSSSAPDLQCEAWAIWEATLLSAWTLPSAVPILPGSCVPAAPGSRPTTGSLLAYRSALLTHTTVGGHVGLLCPRPNSWSFHQREIFINYFKTQE